MDHALSAIGEGRSRVVIENVQPTIDAGQFDIKRTPGEPIQITADVFADGHDVVRAQLLHHKQGESAWRVQPLEPLVNDAWRGRFVLSEVGRHEFVIRGWVDPFGTWHRDFKKRLAAGQDVKVDLQIGARLIGEAAARAAASESDAADQDAHRLRHWHDVLASGEDVAAYEAAAAELDELTARYPDLRFATVTAPFGVVVDCELARFSSWYELFPRSTSGDSQRHGTFREAIGWLPRIAEMGFDVIYLPPIHPIGDQFRKGKNNRVEAEPGDVGSPWAIGAAEGGHQAIHPQLGTLDDFHALLAEARARGIDLALDIAFQCSPDHPYVKEHPEWFRHRPDGTIQYAENPPKKYQDIYPFDFETSDWQALWRELTEVFLYWCEQGVRIFRVDNPHTKALPFWEFCIAEVKARFPETIFLSEAFTRPKIMYRLAKLGFTQSYTYFTWRNTKQDFTEYLTELTQTPVREFFRPSFWPNTPDILPEHLQTGSRAAFVARLILAGTLSSNYGIYGPAFENMEHLPREAGSEEYLDSEKYEIRAWDFSKPENLGSVIGLVNRIRRENPALQYTAGLVFHPTDNDQLLCFSKSVPDGGNRLVVVVNLNFQGEEHGFIELKLEELGLSIDRPYQLHDLLNDETFHWQGDRNFVKLDPAIWPAHIFRVAQA